MSKQNKEGRLVIVSGPSGVGKSTICRRVSAMLKNTHLSVSVTTRPKSKEEVDGRDYSFISEHDFAERVDKGLFLEHAEVFGNRYGTPKDEVEKAIHAGLVVILEIDVQGAKQVKLTYPDAVMIFILSPGQSDLTERMNNRGRDDTESAKIRLDGATGEIAAAWQYYNHMVINDNLEQAVHEVVQIIEQETGERAC